MDPLSRRKEKLIDRRTALVGFGLAALAPLGCFGANKAFVSQPPEPQPEPKPAAAQGRLVATWDKHVKYGEDPARGGAVYPALLGRVYLFGPDQRDPVTQKPVAVSYIGDGDLEIDLFDSTPRGPGSQPKQTDMFCIVPPVLRQFAKADNMIGDGYTILFPWFNYRRDVTTVYLSLRYRSAKGEQLFDQSTLAVDHSATDELAKRGISYVPPAPQPS